MTRAEILAEADQATRDFAKLVAQGDKATGIPKPVEIIVTQTETEVQRFGLNLNPKSSATAITPTSGQGFALPPPPVICLLPTVVYHDAGSGYSIGDILIPIGGTVCAPATSDAFTLRVDSVNGIGAVTATATLPGLGFETPPANPTVFSGGTGTGFTADCAYI